MGTATAIVRHQVKDYAAWRAVYDGNPGLREKHGILDAQVLVDADDKNTITVICRFPSVEAAQAFSSDPELKADMGQAGVSGAPRIEFNVEP